MTSDPKSPPSESSVPAGHGSLDPVVSQRVCTCDYCQKWWPMQERILAKLDGEDKKLFEEFMIMEANQSDDLGAARAKLAGEWPGWEWMKEALKERKAKLANITKTESDNK